MKYQFGITVNVTVEVDVDHPLTKRALCVIMDEIENFESTLQVREGLELGDFQVEHLFPGIKKQTPERWDACELADEN